MTPEERDILDRALDIVKRQFQHNIHIASPRDTQQFLTLLLAEYKYEVFGCLFLSNRHAVIENELLFFGTIDGAAVHPRIVVQKALQHNAAAIICYHNHPSGVSEPSAADEHITRRLREALNLVEIRLLDHIIIGGASTTSFAERGLL